MSGVVCGWWQDTACSSWKPTLKRRSGGVSGSTQYETNLAPCTSVRHQSGSGATRTGPYADAAPQIITRGDAPIVRNVRRGTTTDALAALAAQCTLALVEALLQVRYARPASTTSALLIATWDEQIHEEAFGHEVPVVPVLPMTVRGLVLVGAISSRRGLQVVPKLRVSHPLVAHRSWH